MRIFDELSNFETSGCSILKYFPSLAILRRGFGVDNVLASLLSHFSEEMEGVNKLLRDRCSCSDEPLIEEVGNYLISSGGKRIRPLLVFLSSRLCGGFSEHLVLMAASIELMHTATLLHDDVVDASLLRRGRATAAVRWGNSISVLVGDYLLGRAFELMVLCGSIECLALLSKTSTIISRGEVTQLGNIGNLSITKQIYTDIIGAKTGTLFSAATETAAILCSLDKEKRIALRDFGYHLGICFQVIDDVLDFTSKSRTFGKKAGMDLREKKVTLPVIYAYENGSPALRSQISSCIKSKEPSNTLVASTIKEISQSGAIDYCFDYADVSATKAAACLNVFPDSEIRTSLLRLLEFALIRTH